VNIEEQIRALDAAGMSQREICDHLGLGRGAVQHYRRKLGLTRNYRGPRTPMPAPTEEQEILRLLRSGLSILKVVQNLGIREHAVRYVIRKFNFQRPPAIPPDKRRKIIAALQNRQLFAIHIARNFHVSYKSVLRLAHDIFGTPKFIASRTRPGPFLSLFPERVPELQIGGGIDGD
jgi:DNA-binding CsgD family transcriptional regulator